MTKAAVAFATSTPKAFDPAFQPRGVAAQHRQEVLAGLEKLGAPKASGSIAAIYSSSKCRNTDISYIKCHAVYFKYRVLYRYSRFQVSSTN